MPPSTQSPFRSPSLSARRVEGRAVDLDGIIDGSMGIERDTSVTKSEKKLRVTCCVEATLCWTWRWTLFGR